MKFSFRGLRALTAGALAAALILTTPMSLAANLPYQDLNEDAWYMSSVEYCWQNELMDGITSSSFAPDDLMTRAYWRRPCTASPAALW